MADNNGNNGNVKGELKKLISLQEFDGMIFDIRTTLEEFPLKSARLDESLEEKKAGMLEAEEELKRFQLLKGEKETDIASKEEKVKKYQADLYGIKNNKEFQSLQQEISGIKADISVIEDELLSIFDSIESGKARCEEEKSKFENEKKASDIEKSTILTREKELKSELNEISAKREEMASTVDPVILTQYHRILAKWGKTAVALIVEEFCGECNMQLRPQIINETKLGKKVVLCENCSRILYVED